MHVFEPPHDWHLLSARYKCENSWLTRNDHGMNWHDGEIPYDEFEDILKSTVRIATKIYVKGLEKVTWLDNIIPKVFNIETLGCPSLAKLHVKENRSCSNHNLEVCRDSNCAVRNVIALKRWLLESWDAPVYSMYKETKAEDY